MSYDDFCRCTLIQLQSAVKAHRDYSTSERRDAWERARWVAMVTVQPHVKRRLSLSDLPLPWDAERRPPAGQAPAMSAEQRREAAAAAIRRARGAGNRPTTEQSNPNDSPPPSSAPWRPPAHSAMMTHKSGDVHTECYSGKDKTSDIKQFCKEYEQRSEQE